MNGSLSTGRQVSSVKSSGIDTASYADAAAGVTTTLVSGGTKTGEALGDSYSSIVGNFTADALTQTLQPIVSNNLHPFLNAYVLRDVSPVLDQASRLALRKW